MSTVNENLWENDPTLLPYTAQRRKNVREGVFAYHAKKGHSPAQAFPDDPSEQKLYAQHLKDAKTA